MAEEKNAGGEKGWVSKAALELAKSQGKNWKDLSDEEKKKLRSRAKRAQTAA